MAILTDVFDSSTDRTLDFKQARVEYSAVVDPIGRGVLHGAHADAYDLYAYKFVRITVSVTGNFGEGNIKPALNLKNFLTIYA